jgi:hypothetical protein
VSFVGHIKRLDVFAGGFKTAFQPLAALAVRQALAEGKLKGNERLQAVVVVTLGGIGLSHEIKAEIELE